jgi:tetratricopeptide (TPR) repeat protein/tRNA A-37 threonylcarbamoyl transferase component Bud32
MPPPGDASVNSENPHSDPTVDQPQSPALATAPHATEHAPSTEWTMPVDAPRYRVQRLHARGGLGEVYVADDEELHRAVALKCIQGPRADDPGSRARFLREAELTARLEHPGVVPVYGLVADREGRPCYAMRFIEGETLETACRRFHDESAHSTDPGQVRLQLRHLLSQLIAVCNTLDYAHSRGIIHRDLKPANIMLGRYGETLVVDWGLAKPLTAAAEAALPAQPTGAQGEEDSGTRMGSAVGTPAYMSPEQAGGRLEDVGPASDVFSLGATLYFVLTGQPPHQQAAIARVLADVQAGRFPSPRALCPTTPAPLEAICLKAMSLRPADRYASARALADDLEHWLADEPFAAYREPFWQRLGRWTRRHRTAVITSGVAFCLVVAALVGGLILWETGEARRRAQAEEYVATLRTSAEAGEKLALADMAADHFGSAAKILEEACKSIEEEPALQAALARLSLRRDRAWRLAQFYAAADDVEVLFFRQELAQARRKAEEALALFEVFGHDEWWRFLPVDELSGPQRERLTQDTYRTLLYLAGLRGAEGVVNPGKATTAPALRSALVALAAAEKYRPCRSGAMFRQLCQIVLGERLPGGPLPSVQPGGAVDHYFLGVLHIGANGIHRNPMMNLLFGGSAARVGVDLKTPIATAQRHLQEAARLDPRHFFTYAYLGTAYRHDGQPASAELAYTACVGLRPDYALGYELRAEAIRVQANRAKDAALKAVLMKRALEDASTALRLAPGAAHTIAFRGLMHRDNSEYKAAVADLSHAIELAKSDEGSAKLLGKKSARNDFWLYDLYHARGISLAETGDYRRAIADYGECLRLQPRQAPVHYLRAKVRWRLGEIDQAVADLSSAIAINPSDMSYWLERSHLHAFRGSWREAAADLGRLLELQPNYVMQWRRRAALLMRAGDDAGYRQLCHKLLERFAKTSQEAIASEVVLTCALGPVAREDAASLTGLALRLTRTTPRSSTSQLARGAAHLRLAQGQQAVAALTEAQRLLPDGSPEKRLAYLYLAMAHEQMGEAGQASTWREKAERMRSKPPGLSAKDPSPLWQPPWWIHLECEVLARERAKLPRQGSEQHRLNAAGRPSGL